MTTIFLIYLLKVSLSLALLTILFRVALSADHSFARNRYYLLGALLWSALIPALTSQVKDIEPVAIIKPAFTVSIPEVIISPSSSSLLSSSWGDPSTIILTIYLTGVFIFLVRMFGAYGRILYIISTTKSYTIGSYKIRLTSKSIAPFAFFRWIIIPEKMIEHSDLTKMLIHESVHSRQLHSIDLLIGELFAVFQWFNPASWAMKRLIVENHEYTADHAVIRLGINTYEYQAALVNATVGHEVIPVDHFSLILIKKRINMMNHPKNSYWQKVRSILTPFAFLLALLLTSFTVDLGLKKIADVNPQPESLAAINDEPQNSDPKDKVFDKVEKLPTINGEEAAKGLGEFIAKNLKYPEDAALNSIQGIVHVSFIVEKDGSISNVKVLKSVYPSLDMAAINVVTQSKTWTAGEQKGKPVRVTLVVPIKFALDKSTPSDDSEVFFVCEDMPTFNGKEALMSFRDYIAQNLKYPPEAYKNNIEGNVYVQFIIEKDGSIGNVKILRSANELLDKAAIEVVKNASQWTPGKQNGKPVRVAFTVPISFKLDREKSANTATE